MPRDGDIFRSTAELEEALPRIRSAPKNNGTLRQIVVRPKHGERETPATVHLSLANGVAGDHWAQGCHMSQPDGSPHPDVQICIMPARVIEAIAGPDEAAWAPAGDNLFIDLDLTPENSPPGTRLAIGTTILEITEEPHTGCQNFLERYGRDASVFVNIGLGKAMKMRGIYARVAQDGDVSVGDTVTKV